MKLNELVDKIEARGFSLSGKENIPEAAMQAEMINMPVVLIPSEPPERGEVEMINNLLAWDKPVGWAEYIGKFVRLEGAASLDCKEVNIIRLQFIRRRAE